MPTNLENSAVATGLEKVNFHSKPKERQCQRMFKLPQNCTHLTRWQSNPQNSKPGLNSTWTENFQIHKLDLGKAEEPEIKLPPFIGPWRKQGSFRKMSTSASLTMLKPLTVWIMINCGKFLKRRIPDHLTYLLRNLYLNQEATVRMLHGTMNWFKIGKGVQSCILSSCLLTYMQSTSCEMLGWMHHKLESRLLGEIPTVSDIQMIQR